MRDKDYFPPNGGDDPEHDEHPHYRRAGDDDAEDERRILRRGEDRARVQSLEAVGWLERPIIRLGAVAAAIIAIAALAIGIVTHFATEREMAEANRRLDRLDSVTTVERYEGREQRRIVLDTLTAYSAKLNDMGRIQCLNLPLAERIKYALCDRH